MAKFKFNKFNRGWHHRQDALVSLNGFLNVNNFVILNNAIEKVRGWERLPLQPKKYTDNINTFNQNIDDMLMMINSLNDSFMNPDTLGIITYPLVGPYVQSIFPYVKFEEEDIKLGLFGFDYLDFYGLVPGFNYDIDFNDVPSVDDGDGGTIINTASYGLIRTCDIDCVYPKAAATYHEGTLLVGPAIKIPDDATKDNFTGYALIYDPIAGELILGLWRGTSLKNFDFILDVTPANLSEGDSYSLEQISDTHLRIAVNDSAEATIPMWVTEGLGECFGVVQVQADNYRVNYPAPNPIEFINGVYYSRAFWYCEDGLFLTLQLLPQPNDPPDGKLTSTFDITVKCGFNGDLCYGFHYAQLYNDESEEADPDPNQAGEDYTAFFKYIGAMSGEPRSGIIFQIDESKADPDEFTGWGVIYIDDPGEHRLVLGYWLNESLKNFHKVVAELPVTLTDGSLLGINYTPDLITIQTVIDGVLNATAITLADPEDYLPAGTNGPLRTSRTNVGIGWIGVAKNGLHRARWMIADPATEDPNDGIIVI